MYIIYVRILFIYFHKCTVMQHNAYLYIYLHKCINITHLK